MTRNKGKKFLPVCAIFLFLLLSATQVFASSTSGTDISVEIPDNCKIIVKSEGASVMENGLLQEVYEVQRNGDITLTLVADAEKQIRRVLLDGKDYTSQVVDEHLTLTSVDRDHILTVQTKDVSEEEFFYCNVNGKVIWEGGSLDGALLELYSPLQSYTLDADGTFRFERVRLGMNVLTVTKDEKLIGYAELNLVRGAENSIIRREGNSYVVEVTAEAAYININLVVDGDVLKIADLSMTADPNVFEQLLSGEKGRNSSAGEFKFPEPLANIYTTQQKLFWACALAALIALISGLAYLHASSQEKKKKKNDTE